MGDAGQGAELLLEGVERRRVAVMEGLQRHHLVALAVVGRVDDSHATGPQPSADLESLVEWQTDDYIAQR